MNRIEQGIGLIMRFLGKVAHRASTLHDELFAGVLPLRWHRWRQEGRMQEALAVHDNDSMEARIAVERCRELERGVRFWRIPEPAVLPVLKEAAAAGVPETDLQLLTLNEDIRQSGNGIKVRRAWWAPVLAWCAKSYVVCHWVLLCMVVATAPASWTSKAVVIGVISLLFWFLWPGFSLYSTRAHAAVTRSGAAVEKIAKRVLPAKAAVIPLR